MLSNKLAFSTKVTKEEKIVRERAPEPKESAASSPMAPPMSTSEDVAKKRAYTDSSYDDLINLVSQVAITNPDYFKVSIPDVHSAEDAKEVASMSFSRMLFNMVKDNLLKGYGDGYVNANSPYTATGDVSDEIRGFMANRGAMYIPSGSLALEQRITVDGVEQKIPTQFAFVIFQKPLNEKGGFRNKLSDLSKGVLKVSVAFPLRDLFDPKSILSKKLIQDIRYNAGGEMSVTGDESVMELFLNDKANYDAPILGDVLLNVSNRLTEGDFLSVANYTLVQRWSEDSGDLQVMLVYYGIPKTDQANMLAQYESKLVLENMVYTALNMAWGTTRGTVAAMPAVTTKATIEEKKKEKVKTLKEDLAVRKAAITSLLLEMGQKLTVGDFGCSVPEQCLVIHGLFGIKLTKQNIKISSEYMQGGASKDTFTPLNTITHCGGDTTCKLGAKTGFFRPTHMANRSMTTMSSMSSVGTDGPSITITNAAKAAASNMCDAGFTSPAVLDQMGSALQLPQKQTNETTEQFCARVKTAMLKYNGNV